MTGSISVSGLLGGTASQIDTTSLIASLMQAEAVPQNLLKDQLSTVTTQLNAYQAVNTQLSAVQTAGQALTDPTAWQATATTSSSTAVAATSGADASPGSTTFSVTRLARAQVTTVSADGAGNVISVPSSGVNVTDSTGLTHNISLASGSAADVASAINAASLGVHASVVQTNSGVILQVTSAKSGAANSFILGNTDSPPRNVVAGQDAQVSVGDPAAGGYTVNSSSNTFTGVIPGVTFSANALATDVTLTVATDQQSVSDRVQALVTAVNAAKRTIDGATAQGSVLQGKYDARSVSSALGAAVSSGIAGGGSLKSYGVDLDATGQLSFDASVFASAYAADPAGTKAAISGSFAASVQTTATNAVAPVTGTITSAIAGLATRGTGLNTDIATWTDRLTAIKTGLESKYNAMESALARLQTQQTYVASLFSSLNKASDSSS